MMTKIKVNSVLRARAGMQTLLAIKGLKGPMMFRIVKLAKEIEKVAEPAVATIQRIQQEALVPGEDGKMTVPPEKFADVEQQIRAVRDELIDLPADKLHLTPEVVEHLTAGDLLSLDDFVYGDGEPKGDAKTPD